MPKKKPADAEAERALLDRQRAMTLVCETMVQMMPPVTLATVDSSKRSVSRTNKGKVEAPVHNVKSSSSLGSAGSGAGRAARLHKAKQTRDEQRKALETSKALAEREKRLATANSGAAS